MIVEQEKQGVMLDDFDANHLTSWLLTCGVYAYQMILRVMPVVMLDYLARKVGFNAGQLGMLVGVYYLGYCFAHIPIGLMLDHFQPRNVISGCILVCVAGLYLTIFATSQFEIFASRFLIGAGSAGGILGALKASADFYPSKFGVVLGFTILFGIVGAYFGAEPIKIALASFSYEQVIRGIILFGIMLAATVGVMYSHTRRSTLLNAKPAMSTLAECIKNKKLWSIGICTGLMVGPLSGFADLWGGNYLLQIHNLTSWESSLSITLIFVGLGVGSLVLGFLSKRLASQSRMIVYMGLGAIATLMILFGVPLLNVKVIYALCTVIGLLSAYQLLGFTMAHKLLAGQNVSVSMALLNMIIMLFGFIYHGLIGFILDTFFISSTTDALVYGADAYQAAFSVVLGGIVIGVIGFWSMKE